MANIKRIVVVSSILAGIGGLAYGLYYFYKRQISLALNYCYKISGVKFNKISKNDFNMDLFVKVRNNSDFIVNLLGYSLDIFINKKFIAKVESKNQTEIKNKAVSELGLNIKFSPDKVFNGSDVISLLSYAVTDKSKFVIEVKGNLSAKLNFIKVSNYPIEVKMTLAEILAPEDPNKPKEICEVK